MENDEEISDYERLRLRNIEVLKSKLYENLGDIQTLKHLKPKTLRPKH